MPGDGFLEQHEDLPGMSKDLDLHRSPGLRAFPRTTGTASALRPLGRSRSMKAVSSTFSGPT
ncbi:hypothetical protein D187_001609 [Cystobacter fuscus DSM 2262]|uniref:Uncharacterized protein n=1 Tax=Cystobacter fuscus (strain ATCC 25194 / DSM 2262 / NBRC 100088 / M29) TaxID=1242864 RepID=S9PF08_CYSF2|nr:hypothetical protein D187_001609 [Cystobacter fuscus DSM 2262]